MPGGVRAARSAALIGVATLVVGCGSTGGTAASTVTTTASAPLAATKTVRVVKTETVLLSSVEATTEPEPSAGATWPEPLAVGLAPSPKFVEEIDGWRLKDHWEGMVRTFDERWSAASGAGSDGDYGFPATMNGCDNQMFLVRWRAIGSGAGSVTAGWTNGAFVGASPLEVSQVDGDKVTGSSGWMSLDGCEIPVFTYKPATSADGSIRDVAYSVQQWWPSAA